jgi:hypothetical protein
MMTRRFDQRSLRSLAVLARMIGALARENRYKVSSFGGCDVYTWPAKLDYICSAMLERSTS